MPYEVRLRTLGLPGLEQRRLKGNLIALYSFLRRGSRKGGGCLFSLVTDDRTHRSFLERWLMSQACQCSGGIWITPSIIYLNFWKRVRQLDLVIFIGLFHSIPFLQDLEDDPIISWRNLHPGWLTGDRRLWECYKKRKKVRQCVRVSRCWDPWAITGECPADKEAYEIDCWSSPFTLFIANSCCP